MLTEGHFELFKEFRVRAMGGKLREMVEDDSYDAHTFEGRMGMLIGAEVSARRERKVAELVKQARLKTPSACVEDIAYLPDRKLSGDRIARHAECDWVERSEVMVIVSKTGGGKSHPCQALGNAACRKLMEVRHARLAGMCEELSRARAAADGSHHGLMDGLKTIPLLLADDFMTTPIATQDAVDPFGITEARESLAATPVASQLEPSEWYLRIEGELMADSILSRIATGTRYIDLEGPNMREYFARKKVGWRYQIQLTLGTALC